MVFLRVCVCFFLLALCTNGVGVGCLLFCSCLFVIHGPDTACTRVLTANFMAFFRGFHWVGSPLAGRVGSGRVG